MPINDGVCMKCFLSTGTSNCQQGFFLRGLYRSNGNNVGNIEWGKCCKPSHHPYHWGDCYNEDVSNTFNKAGLSECKRDGYFIAGFQSRASGGRLSSIKTFKCCRMVDGKFGGNVFFKHTLFILKSEYTNDLSCLPCQTGYRRVFFATMTEKKFKFSSLTLVWQECL